MISAKTRRLLPLLLAGSLAFPTGARADEREDLERLRATTLSLIDALVDNGVLSREKATQLIRSAEARAQGRTAGGGAPEIGPDGKKVVRVPYVPESLRREMRDQIKQEVLAQAKAERWGEPGALPPWLERISFEGDLRLRYEWQRLDPANTAPGLAFTDGFNTRAADIVGSVLTGGQSSFNTQEDRQRWRVRGRFGANAKVSEMVSAGMRFSTGNTTDRVSTNQTLGQNFNKYSLVVDRAWLRVDPLPWMSVQGGRIANPWFGTDLVWDEDLNFEGLAMSLRPDVTPDWKPFLTAGWFPLRENSPRNSTSRDLVGVQGGFEWKRDRLGQLKVGAALYKYRGIEGAQETNATYNLGTPLVPDYARRYEYGDGFRQRGNTLFIVNAPLDPNVNWGLASGFRELNLTASLDVAIYDPIHVVLTGDYVRNLAFDRAEIARRTGFAITDGKDTGYLAKVQVGHPRITRRGEWNLSFAYRYLGSDAVLDAFADSDFGLGGTNTKGYILGLNYGIDKNTWLGARWMSSNLIDPMTPSYPGFAPGHRMAVDLFQLDLNARF